MTEFTPGPWEVSGEDEPTKGVPAIEITAGEFGPNYQQICYVSSDLIGDKFVITGITRANARLIAEAPAMYASLTALLTILGGDRSTTPACVEARAVLARARGEVL